MLMESSDWQFLISTWSARDYAENRIGYHSDAFQKLVTIAENCLQTGKPSREERTRFSLLSERDNPFPDINLEYWAEIKEGE